MNGTFLGHRRIRCGWAQHKQDTSSCNFGCIDRADPTNANVYVGNVAADVRSQPSKPWPLIPAITMQRLNPCRLSLEVWMHVTGARNSHWKSSLCRCNCTRACAAAATAPDPKP